MCALRHASHVDADNVCVEISSLLRRQSQSVRRNNSNRRESLSISARFVTSRPSKSWASFPPTNCAALPCDSALLLLSGQPDTIVCSALGNSKFDSVPCCFLSLRCLCFGHVPSKRSSQTSQTIEKLASRRSTQLRSVRFPARASIHD